MKKQILATLLGATLLAGNAHAATLQSPQPASPVMKADSNDDGVITRQEALAAADARFVMLDTNKDGQLSDEERRAGKRHRTHNPDRAGAHDRAGFRQQMIKRFDTDKDGKLSDSERRSARKAWHAKYAERRSHARAGNPWRIDSNGDGLVSQAEMRTAAQARFDRADTDHDGRIDKGEREAAPAKRKAMRVQGNNATPLPAQR